MSAFDPKRTLAGACVPSLNATLIGTECMPVRLACGLRPCYLETSTSQECHIQRHKSVIIENLSAKWVLRLSVNSLWLAILGEIPQYATPKSGKPIWTRMQKYQSEFASAMTAARF